MQQQQQPQPQQQHVTASPSPSPTPTRPATAKAKQLQQQRRRAVETKEEGARLTTDGHSSSEHVMLVVEDYVHPDGVAQDEQSEAGQGPLDRLVLVELLPDTSQLTAAHEPEKETPEDTCKTQRVL